MLSFGEGVRHCPYSLIYCSYLYSEETDTQRELTVQTDAIANVPNLKKMYNGSDMSYSGVAPLVS